MFERVCQLFATAPCRRNRLRCNGLEDLSRECRRCVVTAHRTHDLVRDLGFRTVTELQWGESVRVRDLTVTALKAVRDEMAAYPAARGPRVTYLVATERGEASLVYDGRRRRWYLEAVDEAA